VPIEIKVARLFKKMTEMHKVTKGEFKSQIKQCEKISVDVCICLVSRILL